MPSPGTVLSSDGPVAVIAVHGVSDHREGSVAARAADLLLAVESASGSSIHYGGFTTETLRVATPGLRTGNSLAGQGAWGAELFEQLRGYRAVQEDVVHETVRLEGMRRETFRNGSGEELEKVTEVHVHEMHWSDFGRLGPSVFSLVGAIYRLFFQISWIGPRTLEGWPQVERPPGLGCLAGLNRVHAWMLGRVIPVLNLLMLMLVLASVGGLVEHPSVESLLAGSGPSGETPEVQRWIVAGFAGLALAAVLGTVLVRFGWMVPGVFLFGFLVMAAWTTGSWIYWLCHEVLGGDTFSGRRYAGVCWLLASGLFAWIIGTFQVRHPRLWIEALILWLPVTTAYAGAVFVPVEWPLPMSSAAFAFTCSLALLTLSWIVLIGLAAWVSIGAACLALGLRVGGERSAEVRRRGRARLGTCLVAVGMPTLFVFFLNHCLWAVVFTPIERGWFDAAVNRAETVEGDDVPPGPVYPVLAAVEEGLSRAANNQVFFRELAVSQGSLAPSAFVRDVQSQVRMPVIQTVFVVVLGVVAFTLWCILPSVMEEGRRWRWPGLGEEAWLARLRRDSCRFGRVLSAIYRRWLWLAQGVLVLGLIALEVGFLYQGGRVAFRQGADGFPTSGALKMLLADPAAALVARLPVETRKDLGPMIRRADRWTRVEETLAFQRGAPPEASRGSGTFRVLELAAGLILGLFVLRAYPLTGVFVKPLGAAVRSVVGVGLEVTDYLRPHPRSRTVRARILSRYAGLLKSIATWKGADGRGYSRIVILAHSQGTVITADLLRLLKNPAFAEGNRFDFVRAFEEGRIEIRLFTMGSPLRQIYAERFPDTFGWAGPPAEPGQAPETAHGPDPDRLQGVREWWNVYRAADYVGRYLWRPRKDEPDCFLPHLPGSGTTQKDSLFEARTPQSCRVREYCLAVGGHTGYWDRGAGEVALALDRLVANSDPAV